MSNWKSMETAPIDRRILVFCEETREPFVAQQMTSSVNGDVDWIFARGVNGDGEQVAMLCHPTHWKELPDAPRDIKK